MRPIRLALSLLFTALLSASPPAQASGPDARVGTVEAVIDMLADPAPDLAAFVRASVAPELVERHTSSVLVRRLEPIRAALRGAELEDAGPDGAGPGAEDRFALTYVGPAGEVYVLIEMEGVAPHRVRDLWLEYGAHLDPDARDSATRPPALGWENLEERLGFEVQRGFSGALLVVRNGETVVRKGYGSANRATKAPVTPDTVFGIGSTPIDFTKAGILLLEEAGALSRGDAITQYFEDVPADKRAITIQHLMTGGSGLPDFHDLPGDRDPDHAWIDRDEAVRRILGQELLFAPGAGNEHSHSAWGLLAAILELASGQSYPEFMRENLFGPFGMESTGFFGESVPADRLAIAYGARTDGEVNAPPYWGPTSWLVMGSGGMTSTLNDMERWLAGLRAGAVLSPETLRSYWAPPGAVLAGGDMYGYEISYTEGPETLFLLLNNSNDGALRRATRRLTRELAELVR